MCFFFNDTATTEIYTLSLHDALPILLITSLKVRGEIFTETPDLWPDDPQFGRYADVLLDSGVGRALLNSLLRSEEHTSELQSRQYLVCRLLLEKKNNTQHNPDTINCK